MVEFPNNTKCRYRRRGTEEILNDVPGIMIQKELEGEKELTK